MGRLTDALRRAFRPDPIKQEMYTSRLPVNALASAYENMFAQVRPLVDEMKQVTPYGVGASGGKLNLNRTPELRTLLTAPNSSMSTLDFLDTAFTTWLTESELNIHVWLGSGVQGYSILPVGCRRLNPQGESEFMLPSGKILTNREVMTLRYSRLPRNLDKGVSPASSVYFWTQIDDLMSQYQKAYLENGAVPAHITFISAGSRDAYERKRKQLEQGLHGASNKNKTLFVWRQVLPDNTFGDEIEVKTIQGNNSTLALTDLMNIVSDKLNKAVGVSNFILGDDASAKYDNAELSDRQFTRRRVYPALLMFWNTFQFELDRIVGGLGYGISFDLPLPEITERRKVQAELDDQIASTAIALRERGVSASAIVRALKLDSDWLSLIEEIKPTGKEITDEEKENSDG